MKNTDYRTTGYETRRPRSQTPAVLQLLSSVLAVVVLSGCTGTRALKGGKAFTGRTTGGAMSQVLLQGENPSAPSRQTQETIKVRTYTVPAGGASIPAFQNSSIPVGFTNTPLLQYSSTPIGFTPVGFTVTEREESRAKTELGAAQKDTAREIGAKLSSLKGLVWVGLVMFVFGIEIGRAHV